MAFQNFSKKSSATGNIDIHDSFGIGSQIKRRTNEYEHLAKKLGKETSRD